MEYVTTLGTRHLQIHQNLLMKLIVKSPHFAELNWSTFKWRADIDLILLSRLALGYFTALRVPRRGFVRVYIDMRAGSPFL
jgi:hypothetical protein